GICHVQCDQAGVTVAGLHEAGEGPRSWTSATICDRSRGHGKCPTCIVDATEPGGFDCLGYHFERGKRWPSKKSMGKLRTAMPYL
ncbi:MAG: hypothetical protein R6V58_15970, partial [Planctomycetota bacterium]